MQFDAPINPGNSGGPVFNAKKQVVGIAIATRPEEAEGIGLAIPIARGLRSPSRLLSSVQQSPIGRARPPDDDPGACR